MRKRKKKDYKSLKIVSQNDSSDRNDINGTRGEERAQKGKIKKRGS